MSETSVIIATIFSVLTTLMLLPRTVANWRKGSNYRKDSLTYTVSCIAPAVVFWCIRIFIPNFYSEIFLIRWISMSGSSFGLYLGYIIRVHYKSFLAVLFATNPWWRKLTIAGWVKTIAIVKDFFVTLLNGFCSTI